MRALKVAALQVELPRAVSELVRPQTSEVTQNHMAQRYQPLVFAALAGKTVPAQALRKEMEGANVTPEMAQYAAFRKASGVITAIEASIGRLERRRDQLLKQIEDRRQAIFRAVCEAAEADVVLIAGKGHEAVQEIAGQCHPFSDVEEARRALNARSAAAGIGMAMVREGGA